jgi:hypothetical protein
MKVSRHHRAAGVIAVLAFAFAAPARAQDTATAQALFEEGRRLMDQKKYDEACPKFEASEKIDPALGTLMNLADCYEKAGKTASAWLRFKQAVGEAQQKHRADREATAREHVATLERKLPKIAITVDGSVAGEEILRDGVVIDPAALGLPTAIDPGSHHIEARAPRHRPATMTVDIPEGSGVTPVTIPALPEANDETIGHELATPPDSVPSRGNGQRAAGIVVMSFGGVALAAGAVLGLVASSKWSDAKTNHCSGIVCDATGVGLASDAKTMANASTGLFIGGAIVIVAGIVVYLVAPRVARSHAAFQLGPSGLTGRF